MSQDGVSLEKRPLGTLGRGMLVPVWVGDIPSPLDRFMYGTLDRLTVINLISYVAIYMRNDLS